MIALWLLFSAFALWVAFNLLSAYAVMTAGTQISPGRLPAQLLQRKEARRVRFYVGQNIRSYAFSLWAPPYTIVCFDRSFFLTASPDLLRFVVAHELGHAWYKHHIFRWFAVVSFAALLPAVRRKLEVQEGDADRYALSLTGLSKDMFPQL